MRRARSAATASTRWRRPIWLGLLASVVAFAADLPPIDAVGEWSKQATQRVFEIKERLAGPSEIPAMQSAIAALQARFDATLGEIIAHPDSTETLTETAMRDAQREIDSISSVAEDIGARLTKRGAGLEALIKELTDTVQRAQTIRAGPAQGALTEAFRTRLDLIVVDATRWLAVAQKQLEEVGTLQNEILLIEEREHIARDDLAQAEVRRVKALFELQQPPLWRIGSVEFAGSVSGSSRFVGQAIPGALQFAKDHPARLLLHFVGFLLSYALVVYLRRAFATAPVGAPTSRATTRPISASLLMMLLITPFLYPDAPSGVVQLLGLALVVPLVRILMVYLEPQLHPALLCLVAVFVLERVSTDVARDLVLQRAILLVLNVATMALFAWARSLQISAQLALGLRMTNLVRRLGMVGIGLSALSLLLNVLGNADLAMLLQSTTVRAATIAAGLFATVTVIDELVGLAVHTLKARGVRSVINHDRPVEYEFSPPFPNYVFPLDAGKSWSLRVSATNPASGQRNSASAPITAPVAVSIFGW